MPDAHSADYEHQLRARVRGRMAEEGIPIGTDNPTLLALGATPLLPLAERPSAIPKAALERERAKHPDRSSHFRSATPTGAPMPDAHKGLWCFCGNALPEKWFFAMWCDSCLDELPDSGLTPKEFIAAKEASRA